MRSPFFYVGDKYKLVPQLRQLFPKNIDQYYEPFCGGGSSAMGTSANRFHLNDYDPHVIELHEHLGAFAYMENDFFNLLDEIIENYGLTCSYHGFKAPEELRKAFPKTYYQKLNAEGYKRMRDEYNRTHDSTLLYLLLIYGFNHMIRFSNKGVFNLPVGNVDFNKNVHNAICDYMAFRRANNVEFTIRDFEEFVRGNDYGPNDFVYLDPPYLISGSEYNKYWGEEEEERLLNLLDFLNANGVRFGITNLVRHKGKTNQIFLDWSSKYRVVPIYSNYISFNDNTIKEDSDEVYVCNY